MVMSFAVQLMEKLSAVLLPTHYICGKQTWRMKQIFNWENIIKYLNLAAAICVPINYFLNDITLSKFVPYDLP